MKQLSGTELKRLHRAWRRRAAGRVALLLDSVESPFNVGAIVRTAAAMRVDHLWLAGRTPALDAPKVGKTALGTERYLAWSRSASVLDAIESARAESYLVVGLELADGALPLHELGLAGSVCFVVGHEDRGLATATLRACDHVGFVPQLGKVGSLNVATAVAIAVYEARRQAWNAGDPGGSGL